MVPANTTSLIHSYRGAHSFADSTLKDHPSWTFPNIYILRDLNP